MTLSLSCLQGVSIHSSVRIDLGTTIQQKQSYQFITVGGSGLKRCPKVTSLRIHIGPSLNQQPDQILDPFTSCEAQCSAMLRNSKINIRTSRDQQLSNFEISSLDRHDESTSVWLKS